MMNWSLWRDFLSGFVPSLATTVFVFAVAAAIFSPVQAYRPSGQGTATPTTTAFTAGTSSAQAIAADPQRSSMQIYNASAAATCFVSHAAFGAAVMNGAGSIPLGPLANWIVDNTKDIDAINVICSASSTPITILTWD